MEKIFNIFKKYKGYIFCIVVIVLASLSIFIQTKEKNDINGGKTPSDDKIGVYIVGQVINPGVYYVKKNSRLYELLDIAGGVTDEADIDKLNMAQIVKDSDKIVIYKKQDNQKEELEGTDSYSNKININTADKEALMSLSGIGESTANKIIEYRKNFTFESIEDIMNVPSIGKSKFDSIKDSISVD